MRSFIAVFVILFTVAQATAKTPASKAGDLVRHVKKGGSITITAYDEKVRAFAITVREEPAVGPNFAEPGEIRKAVELEGDTGSVVKNKEHMIGSVYQLKTPLLLLTENQ